MTKKKNQPHIAPNGPALSGKLSTHSHHFDLVLREIISIQTTVYSRWGIAAADALIGFAPGAACFVAVDSTVAVVEIAAG